MWNYIRESIKYILARLEVFIWLAFLMALFFMEEGRQFSFCIFKLVGFERCPGCGIGHAIHYALHLQFVKSMQEHIAGIPGAIWIIIRIVKLIIVYKNLKPNNGTNVYDAARLTT